MIETDDIYQLIELLKSETLKYEESSKVIYYSFVVHMFTILIVDVSMCPLVPIHTYSCDVVVFKK